MAKSKDMNVVDKVQGVLRSPSSFFKSVRSEKGLKGAFVYFAVISLVSSILNYLVNPASRGLPTVLGNAGLALIPAMWVLGLLVSFIVYGFFHLFVMLLGGKKGYNNTYKAFAYSSTPSSLLGWIPGIFLLSGGLAGVVVFAVLMLALIVWAIYLNVKGLSVLQEMSMGRALAALVIGVVVIVAIALVLGVLLVSALLLNGLAV